MKQEFSQNSSVIVNKYCKKLLKLSGSLNLKFSKSVKTLIFRLTALSDWDPYY